MSKLANRPRCRDYTSTGEPCRNWAAKNTSLYKPGYAMTYFKWCANHLRRHGIYAKSKAENQAEQEAPAYVPDEPLSTTELNPFSRLSVLAYVRDLSDAELLQMGLYRLDKGQYSARPDSLPHEVYMKLGHLQERKARPGVRYVSR